ncbi:cation transporter [Streptococcus moroccensis]|uniref:Co/Zn/Cd cation transporter (Cation efflux family) n=1 Tax=Streptococcus moroccensis TaxID=1451356 RepID=A0ABT9YNU4_9STRE|nr:cation transporter [Streptococcus moroccensis]MDQ0221652.1 putative Co/Zn/Cd cation transporter (cation efflux family) [Streptococcus moroccensis]
MHQKQIEKKALLITAVFNFFSGTAGIIVYILTGLNAILLDGVFTFIAFLSAVVAILISQNSHKQTKSFPQGLHFMEPLYGVFKAAFTLFLLGMTVVESASDAYAYFVEGIGAPIVPGPALPYAFLMAVLCILLSFYLRRMNQSIHHASTMLAAESKSSLIDGLISAGVGLAVLVIRLVAIDGTFGFLHYTGDFFIIIFLVIVSIKEPIDVLKESSKELFGATLDDGETIQAVRMIVKEGLAIKEDDVLDILVYKQGMKLVANVVIQDPEPEVLKTCLDAKPALQETLNAKFPHIELVFTF